MAVESCGWILGNEVNRPCLRGGTSCGWDYISLSRDGITRSRVICTIRFTYWRNCSSQMGLFIFIVQLIFTFIINKLITYKKKYFCFLSYIKKKKIIIVPGENMVSKSSHEVEEHEGARIAGERRLAGANTAEQEQSKSGSERRRWRQGEDNRADGRQPLGKPATTGWKLRQRGRRGNKCDVISAKATKSADADLCFKIASLEFFVTCNLYNYGVG